MRRTIKARARRRNAARLGGPFQVAVAVVVTCVFAPAVSAQDSARRCLLDPPDRAVASCRDAVRLAPDDFVARRSLAAALTARGDTTGAVDEFREIARRD